MAKFVVRQEKPPHNNLPQRMKHQRSFTAWNGNENL